MTAHQPYKEPVFLFTSCSLRFAAWAGWYSAMGDEKKTEQWCHQARSEWIKELAAGRRFVFAGRYNHDVYEYIDPKKINRINQQVFPGREDRDKKRQVQKGRRTGMTGNAYEGLVNSGCPVFQASNRSMVASSVKPSPSR